MENTRRRYGVPNGFLWLRDRLGAPAFAASNWVLLASASTDRCRMDPVSNGDFNLLQASPHSQVRNYLLRNQFVGFNFQRSDQDYDGYDDYRPIHHYSLPLRWILSCCSS